MDAYVCNPELCNGICWKISISNFNNIYESYEIDRELFILLHVNKPLLQIRVAENRESPSIFSENLR
jgi:hypothetical protein